MKKLMIALAVAAIAVASQAATVNWKSGASIQGPDAMQSGKFNGTALKSNTYTMYVWDTLTKAEYDALDITSDSFYTTWSAKTDSAISKGVKASNATLGATAANKSAGDDKDYYAAILFTYTDADGKNWYIANKATVHTDALGNGGSAGSLAKNIGGGSGTAITGWTAVAPEPTSGLLLLLGVAGLALRRRRA